MSYKATLTRTFKESVQVTGQLDVWDKEFNHVYKCYTLELADRQNQKRISCIPTGNYVVKSHVSPKFGKCFWIQDVPNRSAILIHSGTYHNHSLGCILVGEGMKDLNKDGYLDLIHSKKAMAQLVKYNITEIEIIEI